MSTPLLLKICGLRTPEDAEAVVAAKAQLGGLVFARVSPRRVGLREAHKIKDRLFGHAEIVGLFADNAFEEIAAIHQGVGLDRVQLHGAEDDRFAERVEGELGLPVLRAVPVAEASDAAAADKRKGSAFLFDAKPPPGHAQKGGHGYAFPWQHLAAYGGERKFLLAGGLTPATVGDAMAAASHHPSFAGLDVSSGVEKAKGVKDKALILALAKNARDAHEKLAAGA